MTTFQIILIIAIPSILIASLVAYYLRKLYKKNLELARQELCTGDWIWIIYGGKKIKVRIDIIQNETVHCSRFDDGNNRHRVIRKLSEVWPLSYQD